MIVLSQQLITAAWIHHGFDLNITKNSMYLVSYKLYVHRCKDKEDNREQDCDIEECLEANLIQLEEPIHHHSLWTTYLVWTHRHP